MPFPIADITRLTATTATALGVGKVLSDVIKNNTSPVTKLDKIQLQVGGYALSIVVAGFATARMEETVRSVAEKVSSLRKIEEVTDPTS
jgi:hypothetical protein